MATNLSFTSDTRSDTLNIIHQSFDDESTCGTSQSIKLAKSHSPTAPEKCK